MTSIAAKPPVNISCFTQSLDGRLSQPCIFLQYDQLARIGEGQYGVVFRARDLHTGMLRSHCRSAAVRPPSKRRAPCIFNVERPRTFLSQGDQSVCRDVSWAAVIALIQNSMRAQAHLPCTLIRTCPEAWLQ